MEKNSLVILGEVPPIIPAGWDIYQEWSDEFRSEIMQLNRGVGAKG